MSGTGAALPGGLELTLFVAGDSAASRRSRARLDALLEGAGLMVTPRIVDVLGEPEAAMRHRVFVTPALVVRVDGHEHTIIGDLTHTEAVVALLQPRR